MPSGEEWVVFKWLATRRVDEVDGQKMPQEQRREKNITWRFRLRLRSKRFSFFRGKESSLITSKRLPPSSSSSRLASSFKTSVGTSCNGWRERKKERERDTKKRKKGSENWSRSVITLRPYRWTHWLYAHRKGWQVERWTCDSQDKGNDWLTTRGRGRRRRRSSTKSDAK